MEFSYTNAGVSADEIKQTAEGLLPYLSELKTFAQDASYAHPESFLHLVHDEKYINEITALANQKGGAELKHIFLVGIGGSNLGTRAVYEAYFGNEDLSARVPRIHFLDTIDTPHLEELAPFIEKNIHNPNEFIVLYISKSGNTTESALNVEYLTNTLSKKFSPEDVHARTIVITNEDSDLWKGSKEKNITTLRIPQTVGGRFSVFSAVGLLPLALAGIPITDVLTEARNVDENHALASAVILYHYLRAGYAINNTFLFAPELESLGKWYRQLSAESLGKGDALSPEIAVGTTDLHSTAQLYIDGPKNRITTFVWLPENNAVTNSPGGTLETVRSSIYEGVKQTYIKEALPFMEMTLSTPASCGAFMATKMIETLLFAHLVNINPFDQPAVETYKEEVRRIIESR